jgi:hypothetical protein
MLQAILRGAIVVPVLVVISAGMAAPAPRDRPAGPIYAPIAVGDRLVYEASGKEITEKVTTVTQEGRARVVTIESTTTGPEAIGGTILLVAPDGLFHVAMAGPGAPPHCLIRLPASAGTKWDYKLGSVKGTSIVFGEEEVEVPAGTFKALRVDSEHPGPDGRTVRYSIWYVAGVGMVKTVCGADVTKVLKSFTPSKK